MVYSLNNPLLGREGTAVKYINNNITRWESSEPDFHQRDWNYLWNSCASDRYKRLDLNT